MVVVVARDARNSDALLSQEVFYFGFESHTSHGVLRSKDCRLGKCASSRTPSIQSQRRTSELVHRTSFDLVNTFAAHRHAVRNLPICVRALGADAVAQEEHLPFPRR